MSYFPLFPFWILAVCLVGKASYLEISRRDEVFQKQVPTWEAVVQLRQTTLQDSQDGWTGSLSDSVGTSRLMVSAKVGAPQSRMEISRMPRKSHVLKEKPASIRAEN